MWKNSKNIFTKRGKLAAVLERAYPGKCRKIKGNLEKALKNGDNNDNRGPGARPMFPKERNFEPKASAHEPLIPMSSKMPQRVLKRA